MTSVEDLLGRSIILLDKPSGPTCRVVDDRVKLILGRKKTGHSGTLDSKVSGLLLVALDEATKIMPFFERSDKIYNGVIYLHGDVGLEELQSFIDENFIGKITQLPPVKSRVARKPRERTVYSFKTLKKDGNDVYFETKVEAGTYIRKLIHDIGEKFGVGMHMKSLRRTHAGEFSVENSVKLEDLEKAYESWKLGDESSLKEILIPVEKALKNEKKVLLKGKSIEKILNGSPVYWDYIEKIDKLTKNNDRVLLIYNDRIIGIGIAKMDYKKMPRKRTAVIKTDRLLLD